MAKEYKYQDETFLLDDSKGCYIEITYKGMKGYVGVNLSTWGSAQAPYVWWAENAARFVTPDGLTGGNSNGTSQESNLAALCDELIRKQREIEAHAAFDREKACHDLHEWVEKL